MTIAEELNFDGSVLLIGKNFADEGFLIFEHAAGSLHCFRSIDA